MLLTSTTAAQRAAWNTVLEESSADVAPGRTPFMGPTWACSRASRIAPHLRYPELTLAYGNLPNGQSMLSAMPPKVCRPLLEAASPNLLAQVYALACQEAVDLIVGAAALRGAYYALCVGDRATARHIAVIHDSHIFSFVMWGVTAGMLFVTVAFVP